MTKTNCQKNKKKDKERAEFIKKFGKHMKAKEKKCPEEFDRIFKQQFWDILA